MLDFHLMASYPDLDLDSMRKAAVEYDIAGYKSVLYTFHSASPDNFVKVSRILNTDHSFKYLFALRPYHLSPQYLQMVVSAFNEIQPDRVAINWLAGDFDTRIEQDEFMKQTNVFGETEPLKDVDSRKKFVRDFVEKFYLYGEKVYSVFSGKSDYSLETARIFEGTILCMVDDFLQMKSKFIDNKKIMVAIKLIIRDSEEDAVDALNSYAKREREKNFSIIGTKESVKEQFLNLEKEGVTDIMITLYDSDQETRKRVHTFIRDFDNKSLI